MDSRGVFYNLRGDLFTIKLYTFDATVEWNATVDNTKISNYPLTFERNYVKYDLVGTGDRRAKDSGRCFS